MDPRESGGSAFTDYYRCPPQLSRLRIAGELSHGQGYFQFGGTTAFGRCVTGLEVGDRAPACAGRGICEEQGIEPQDLRY